MAGLGVPELLIILAIILVLFGAKRLPEAGRALGSGMREFKDSVTGKSRDDDADEAPAALPEAAAPPVAEAAKQAAAESDSAAQSRS